MILCLKKISDKSENRRKKYLLYYSIYTKTFLCKVKVKYQLQIRLRILSKLIFFKQ